MRVIDEARLVAKLFEMGSTVDESNRPACDRTFEEACRPLVEAERKRERREALSRNFRTWRLIGGPLVAAFMWFVGWISWEIVAGAFVLFMMIELVEDAEV